MPDVMVGGGRPPTIYADGIDKVADGEPAPAMTRGDWRPGTICRPRQTLPERVFDPHYERRMLPANLESRNAPHRVRENRTSRQCIVLFPVQAAIHRRQPRRTPECAAFRPARPKYARRHAPNPGRSRRSSGRGRSPGRGGTMSRPLWWSMPDRHAARRPRPAGWRHRYGRSVTDRPMFRRGLLVPACAGYPEIGRGRANPCPCPIPGLMVRRIKIGRNPR